MGMLTVSIETDNDAFSGDAKYNELPRILRKIADTIEGGSLLGSHSLLDSNGNYVGEARYDEYN